MIIKKTTGYVQQIISIKNLPTQQDISGVIMDGSNSKRSYRGRPYRVNGDPYLKSIRAFILQNLRENGFKVGNTNYTISDGAYQMLITEGEYKNILPDDLYDSIFLAVNTGTIFQNPNTGLVVTVLENVIISISIEHSKSVMYNKNTKLSKGSGSAHRTGSADGEDECFEGFNDLELDIIREAKKILHSPEMQEIRNAHDAGEYTRIVLDNRIIQYENLDFSGFTMFGENGFVIGKEAFQTETELMKTILHELYRLNTSQSSEGVTSELAARETKEAFDFAEKAWKEIEKGC